MQFSGILRCFPSHSLFTCCSIVFFFNFCFVIPSILQTTTVLLWYFLSLAHSHVHLSLCLSPNFFLFSPVCCSLPLTDSFCFHFFFASCAFPQSFTTFLYCLRSVLCCLSVNLSSLLLSFCSPLSPSVYK